MLSCASKTVADAILREFSLDPEEHISAAMYRSKSRKAKNPVKTNGKLPLAIDGGFARAYQARPSPAIVT